LFLSTTVLAQTQNLAAAQLAAMSSNVRFNSGPVMMVEQLRHHHQQHPVHPAFSTGATTVTGTPDKTGNYPLCDYDGGKDMHCCSSRVDVRFSQLMVDVRTV
jgi:hypothetical protein